MEEKIETRVSSERIWQAWESAHRHQGGGSLVKGYTGTVNGKTGKGIRYEVLDVDPGKSFSIVWKTLFVRLVFSQSVAPVKRGSEIRYSIAIRGPFAIPIRWLLGNKIRYNISQALKAMVKQLENF